VTNEELTELERLCKQATPGPWRYDDGRTDGDERGKPAWVDTITAAGHTLIAEPSDHPGLDAMDANARLIVAVVNALPRLIARVRELESAERRAYERAARACRESVDGLRKTAASHRAEHNQRGANYYEAAADGALAAWSAIRALAPAEGKEGE
jgi:hypothetical protein